jgi:hypothetical protein
MKASAVRFRVTLADETLDFRAVNMRSWHVLQFAIPGRGPVA